MEFTTKEERDLVINSATPDMTPDALIKWMDHLESFFDDIYDEKGKIDFEKAVKVASFTIGRVHSLLNRNLMRQKNILAEMEQKLAVIRRTAIESFEKTVPYDLNAKQKDVFIQGDSTVSAQTYQVQFQINLIGYIERIFSQTTFYNSNLKNLFEIHEKASRGGF